ncbi:hypothetical protein N7493_001146 [Penicillium malachiteum]|uniref:Actin-like ATPase domain-containing protein n=1 Tax=Penicillium malachiteum TaxID=1324776 RepID=A0AAD6HTP6_9EURO|nr:hypothetical protein N7493_001146 [Penicillium malachiteum]
MGSRQGEKIIVGIDHGTTSTEIVFGLSSSENFQFMRDWPGAPSLDRSFECPSIISYPQGSNNPHQWGFGVPKTLSNADQKFVCFKLMLDDGLERSEFYDETLEYVLCSKALQLPDGKTATSVMTDFLSEVYKFLEYALISLFGEEKFRRGAIDFYFTVPACWLHQTQDAMRMAIEDAGFGSYNLHEVKLLAEPEAAVMSVIQEEGLEIETGDGVMICDCGGAESEPQDIATYRVTDLSSASLERMSATMGGKCGGASIDCRLYEHLTKRTNGEFWHLPLNNILTGSTSMNLFEMIKSEFSGEPWSSYILDLIVDTSGHHAVGIKLDGKEMAELYNPTLETIFKMIMSELNGVQAKYNHQIIKKIVFVGGFSNSPYLQNWMQRILQQFHEITVLISKEPSLAVAKGAFLRGKYEFEGRLLEQTIKCWRHYGLACSSLNTNLQNEAYLGMESPYRTQCWVLRKDKIYQLPHSQRHELIIPHLPSDSPMKVVSIYECTSEAAPEVLQTGNPTVNLMGYITCDLSQLKLSQFPQRTLNGHVCHVLRVSVKVSLSEKKHRIHFVASVHGKEVGKHSIRMAIV